MRQLNLIAGLCLIVSASAQVWDSVAMRRRGASWRGTALTGAAFAVYGFLAVLGVVPSGTYLSAGLMSIIAVAASTGFWLNRRDARKSGPVR